VTISGGSECLLAFVALRFQAVRRLLVAGTLWSEVSELWAYATRARLTPISLSSRMWWREGTCSTERRGRS
jgi:hypothetical protein